jgi:alpha-mannosidase
MGFRRVSVRRAPDGLDSDDETLEVVPGDIAATITADEVRVSLRDDGSFDVRIGERDFPGLGGLESTGDRGDSYDYDEIPEETRGPGLELESVSAERRRHPSGIQELAVLRRFQMPARLSSSREERSAESTVLEVETVLRVLPGVPRVDIDLRVENSAEDHRLRMLFPVHGRVEHFQASTTFDVAERTPGRRDDTGWAQAAPATFPHQGFVHADGLSVVAPGLPEAEVVPGEPSHIAITLLRCVGSLSRADLRSRPGLAGPGTDTPGAQCPGSLTARLCLLGGLDPAAAREAELGLRAVACGDAPLVSEGDPLVSVEPAALVISALKPAEEGDGLVLRVSNPTAAPLDAHVTLGFPFDTARSLRLDEEPDEHVVTRKGATLHFSVRPHALRTVGIS